MLAILFVVGARVAPSRSLCSLFCSTLKASLYTCIYMSTIDRLNIPAFKRKNELKRKARRKHLILTALDRKRAGLPLSAGIEVPAVLKATIPQLRTMAHVAKLEYTAQESIPLGKKS